MKRLKQVWQYRRVVAIPPGAPRLNCLAALISGLALGILWLTFHAKPAGAGHELSAKTAPQLQVSSPAPEGTADAASSSALSSLPPEELNRRMHTVIHSSKLALQLHQVFYPPGETGFRQFHLHSHFVQAIQRNQIISADARLRHQYPLDLLRVDVHAAYD